MRNLAVAACLLGNIALLMGAEPAPVTLARIPERLVVLTFDDSVKSQFTVVRPALLKRGFGATFFISEGWDFATNKVDYMTWQEIAQLHKDGFEIGNHTRSHMGLNDRNLGQISDQLGTIADRCREHGIPVPTSFAYPGNAITTNALPFLRECGIQFARRGGAPENPYEGGRGVAYEPGLDHPLLIPTAGDARPDWTLDDFVRAVQKARDGRIAVLQFHGVPDRAHPWVNTPPEKFEAYLNYLAANQYKVIALRDLAKYVDLLKEPRDPIAVIEARKKEIAASNDVARALQKKVEEIAQLHHGKVALFAKKLKTGQTVALNADEVVQTASTIKLAALIEAFYQIKAGKKSLGDKVTLKKEDQVGGSGILQFLQAPVELTLEDALTFMVIASDNTGTNLIIDELGLKNINDRISSLGLKNTCLYKKVFKPAEGPMPADQPKFGLGKTTAREMAQMMESIERGDLGDAELCKKMIGMLKRQQYRESIPRYIEGGDTSEVPLAIANKTGALAALRADVAIVYTKSANIVISGYTYENKDQRWNPDNEGCLTIANLAKAIMDAWAPNELEPAKKK
ncbi:MAG: serine hydrolase [Verrucomicrobia bacterium]|nr:serine hydrolase [Verrucomicrobiota bacterium]